MAAPIFFKVRFEFVIISKIGAEYLIKLIKKCQTNYSKNIFDQFSRQITQFQATLSFFIF